MAIVEVALGIYEGACEATGGAHIWVEADRYEWCGCGVNRHTNENGTYWYSRRRK